MTDSQNAERFQNEMDFANAERAVNWNRRPARTEAERAARAQEVADEVQRVRFERANEANNRRRWA